MTEEWKTGWDAPERNGENAMLVIVMAIIFLLRGGTAETVTCVFSQISSAAMSFLLDKS